MAPPTDPNTGPPAAGTLITFTFEPFNPATSKFDRWLDRLQISFRIYHVRKDDQRDFLLHYMGGPTYDVLCNKLKNAEPTTKTYSEIVALLKEHFSPTPLEILENFKFASRKQQDNESLSDYLMNLEKLAQSCNFGDYLDRALRNQFVFGIRNRVIQSRLLEVRDSTLTKAKEIAYGMEMSHRGVDEMHNSRPKSEVQHIEHGANKTKKSAHSSNQARTSRGAHSSNQASTSRGAVRQPSNPEEQRKRCYRCGDAGHYADRCKYKTAICKFCTKKGHLEKMCLAKTKQRTDGTHHLEEQPCIIKDIFHLSATGGLPDFEQ
ncbi:uncharacterized protein LOC126567345 [Anopheles maculipalpis]|uniref:uncharacterized protein LOC126567345 n=1 Tax=Anopheles maculipalpis TaxID=1496333 RepID=UPI002158F700|nr:uncharacterized protein LOC126567345 [Anopheles maculipalpis]